MGNTQLSLFGAEEQSPFENIKHLDPDGTEYWLARELMVPLGYRSWQFFVPVVEKAQTACSQSNYHVDDHFMRVHDLITHGKGGTRKIPNIRLTRYACYLIAMNGNPRKQAIADAQTYFAIKTHEAETADRHRKARLEGKVVRKEFTAAARDSHITHTPDYGGLTNATYQILFGAAKSELVKTLALTPVQANQFRDNISTLALRAIQMAEEGAASEFGGLSGMQSKEQIATVCKYAHVVAPTIHTIAIMAGVDLLSGKRLLPSQVSI